MEILTRACEQFLSEAFQLFWVIATLTDSSFEIGNATQYKAFIRHYRTEDVGEDVIEQLNRGINGNLVKIITDLGYSVEQESARQTDNGRVDIIYTDPQKGKIAVEVKYFYDCTMPKYMEAITSDRQKLQSMKVRSDIAERYQVIFFVSLPNYRYPRGSWIGKYYKAREDYLHFVGHAEQLFQSKKALSAVEPVWPAANPPRSRPLKLTRSQQAVEEWFRRIFKPADKWLFELNKNLKDARVGVAIWRF